VFIEIPMMQLRVGSDPVQWMWLHCYEMGLILVAYANILLRPNGGQLLVQVRISNTSSKL
jgi:hypothetical protein